MFGFLLGMMGMMSVAMAEQEPVFRMVGLYDASSVMGKSNKIEQRFLWTPSKQMNENCGPSKAPDALGLFESEAVANQMTPTLAIVLEYTDLPVYVDAEGNTCTKQEDGICEAKERPAISSKDITVGLGVDKIEYQLQPMVLPRYLSINIDGYTDQIRGKQPDEERPAGVFDTTRYQKLIRTQLEIELCLEHKVGRGWLGNDKDRLRQAFLLDPPDGERLDRKYFGGQRDPVPALIGPSDACVFSNVEMPKDVGASKGKGALMLTPSDIWGSSLRNCEKGLEEGGKPLMRAPKTIPLELSENGIRQARKQRPKWQGLSIDVEARGEKETDVYIDVSLDGEPIPELQNVNLFPEEGSMMDILAHLNHHYPRVGTKLDSDRYVVLLVPNWQVVEGLRRMYSRTCVDDSADLLCKCSVKSLGASLPNLDDKSLSLEAKLDVLDQRLACKDIDGNYCSLSREIQKAAEKSPAEICLHSMDVNLPMAFGGEGNYDGVGWLLDNPQQLFVQVGTKEKNDSGFDIVREISALLAGDSASSAGEQKPNLAGVAQGGFLGLQDWGYTVGQLSGRAPIVLSSDERVSWEISAEAQRYRQHSYFVVSCFILLGFGIAGFRRIADFWTPIPEERAYYWPGRQASNESQDAEGVELNDSAEGSGGE